ncbi:cupin domain-containing protein [Sodalis praecaptivus]|uniref:cupin domain-containing protein n=1 Tax=Sodalis praecaptivus TaxID=1239307 RepID=UPI0037DA78E0
MKIETLSLAEAANGVPNNLLPVVIYRGVIPGGTHHPAVWLDRHFASNGWPAQWRYGIYPFTHFHSNTHELLGVYAGQAQIQLGGETGPLVTLAVGDVVLIPAGVGHKAIDTSEDFMVVGAYPPDVSADLYRDDATNLDPVRARVAQVPLPATDPLSGDRGGITTLWHNAEQA